MLLAKWLNAQVHLVSTRQGITREWTEERTVNIVPVFYPRRAPGQAGSAWDHSAYQPDVIVINDGTDFDAGPLDEAAFTDAYAPSSRRCARLSQGPTSF